MSSTNQHPAWSLVDHHAAAATALADAVWEVPELNFTEHRSCALHAAALDAAGFTVARDVAGLPTAVTGESGTGGPTIAILGEYDALPGLGQEAHVTRHAPLPGDNHGHGCGHNLLGAASLLAATAVKDWLAATGTPGRVRYYGCPAEEGGAGKAFMVRDGAFADVDLALCWHPGHFSALMPPISLANQRLEFTFTGRAAHAAAAPFLGRSALDAVELTSVGVNYLREHMLPSARVHYAYQDAGGVAPNVVQSRARVQYSVRALDLADMLALVERVRRIAEGAALMTETTVECRVLSGMANLVGNEPLDQALQLNLERLGPPPFTDDDRRFAGAIRDTLTPTEIDAAFHAMDLPVDRDLPLCDRVPPRDPRGRYDLLGSTDVGDVSWVVPTAQAWGATAAIGTPLHSWQLTAQGKSPLAHAGMVHVAKALAATAIDAFRDPALVDRARAAHADRAARYTSPLPPDLRPPTTTP